MNFYLNAAFSLLIVVPAVTGWIRYKKTEAVYFPFLLLLTAGFLNEAASFAVTLSGNTNTELVNLYTLLEGILLL